MKTEPQTPAYQRNIKNGRCVLRRWASLGNAFGVRIYFGTNENCAGVFRRIGGQFGSEVREVAADSSWVDAVI